MPDLVGPLVHLSEYLEPALGTHAERCNAVSGVSFVSLLYALAFALPRL